MTFGRIKNSIALAFPGLAGVAGADASSRQRAKLDFNDRPDSPLVRVCSVQARGASGPAPAAQAPVIAPSDAAAQGACVLHPGSLAEDVMRSAVLHALPGLRRPRDAATQARLDQLVQDCLALEKQFVAANEYGLSFDRVLAMVQQLPIVRQQGGSKNPASVAQALGEFEKVVSELGDEMALDAVTGRPSRKGVVRAELFLSMPAFSQLSSQEHLYADGPCTRLVKELVALDARFKDDKGVWRKGYSFNRLFATLANHARILEYGQVSGDPRSLANLISGAFEGLRAIAGTVSESLEDGRDGFELAALVGIDGDLDTAIAEVRVECVKKFMLQHSRRFRCKDDPPSLADLSTIEVQAKDLVTRECEVARARIRLMRAFDRAGVARPVEVIRGLRMDENLVRILQARLDQAGGGARSLHAKEFGLVIMGLYLAERDLADSQAGARMRNDIESELKGPQGRKLRRELRGPAQEASANDSRARQRILEARADDQLLRRLEPRHRALAPLNPVAGDVIEALGLSGFEERHIVQLERQGLSSAAEARAVLATVTKTMQGWVADDGPARMKQQGLLDVLSSVRREENAAWFGKELLNRLYQANVNIALPDGAARQPALLHAVRAAIAQQIAEQIATHGSAEPLDAEQITDRLRRWNIHDEVGFIIEQQLEGGVTVGKLADWAREANVPLDPATVPQAAGQLREQLVRKLCEAKPALRLPADGDAARADAVNDAVRAAILHQLTVLQRELQAKQDKQEKVQNSTPAPKVTTPPLHMLNRREVIEAGADSPSLAQRVATTLGEWGVTIDAGLRQVIDAELADGVTPEKLAAWANKPHLQAASAPADAGAELTSAEKRTWLGKRILRQLPGATGPKIALQMPKEEEHDEHRARLILRDAVRAAAIAQIPQGSSEGYTPDQAKIRETLVNWCPAPDATKGAASAAAAAAMLDRAIDGELQGGITAEKLAQWEKDVVARESHRALVDSLANPKIGTRVKVTDTQRAKLQTGTLTSLWGVNLKGGAGTSESIAFEHPVDAFELNLKLQAEMRVGAEFSVPLTNYPELGVSVGPAVTKEFATQRVIKGVSLRYSTGAKQQAGTERLLRKLSAGFDGQAPSLDFDDLAEVDSLMLMRETTNSGEASLGVQATLEPGSLGFGNRRFGIAFRARLMGLGNHQRMHAVSENNRAFIRKVEETTTVGASATATGHVHVLAGQDGVMVPAFELQKKIENLSKKKSKLVERDDGQAVNGTEIVEQQFASGMQAAEGLVGPELVRIMGELRQSHPQVHSAVEALINGVRANEMLSIASPLDPDKFHERNALRKQEIAFREHRANAGSIKKDKAHAASLHRRADKVLKNPLHYNIGRIGDIAVIDRTSATNYLMGIIEHSKAAASENIPEEVKLYFDQEYKKALIEIARLARKEMLYRDNTPKARVRRFFRQQP